MQLSRDLLWNRVAYIFNFNGGNNHLQYSAYQFQTIKDVIFLVIFQSRHIKFTHISKLSLITKTMAKFFLLQNLKVNDTNDINDIEIAEFPSNLNLKVTKMDLFIYLNYPFITMQQNPNEFSINEMELQFITNSCGKNVDLNNRQIKSMLSTLASNLLQLLRKTQNNYKYQKKIDIQQFQSNINQEINSLVNSFSTKISLLDAKIQKIIDSNDQKIKQFHDSFSKQIMQCYQNLNQSIIKNRHGYIQNIHEIGLQMKKYMKDIYNGSVKIEQFKYNENKIQKISEKIRIFENKIYDLEDKISIIQLEKGGQKKTKLELPLSTNMDNMNIGVKSTFTWVDQQITINKFDIIGNQICAKQPAYIFGKKILKSEDRLTISMNVLKAGMWMGVVQKMEKPEQNISRIKNRIFYASYGQFCEGEKWEFDRGSRFSTGAIVIMEFNLQKCSIIWKTDQRIIYECFSPLLKNRKINWVPFVYLHTKGDKIRIFE